MNQVSGFTSFRSALQAIIAGIEPVVEDALRQEAIGVIQNAQTGPDMPVLSGDLANSGDVGEVESSGPGKWTVEFGFGGGTVTYAWLQHEGGTTPTGGQVRARKYLEKPLMDSTSSIASNLASKLGAGIVGLVP